MKVPVLPDDLVAFLCAGRRLEYNPAKCETGLVTLIVSRHEVAVLRLVS